jgi:hypothetical protein
VVDELAAVHCSSKSLCYGPNPRLRAKHAIQSVFGELGADVAAAAAKGKRGFHLAAISLGTAGKLLESLNPNFAIPETGITGL